MSVDRFPVEAGHIMMFARAIGDPNPAYYRDVDAGPEPTEIVAPPTFVEASLHYDPAFPYRPRIGEPWFGSAAESSSAPPPEPAAGPGESGGTSFHAETHLEYFGLLRPGDLLVVHERPGQKSEKKGTRGGRLWFDSYVLEFLRGDTLLVRSTTVVVTTEAKIDPAAGGLTRSLGEAIRARRPEQTPARYPIVAPAAGDLCTGDTRELVLVENLTRAQILMYAGASGDFSPQHTDEIWNTKVAGYPTTFAHGMLTMGMTGRVLTDWFGNAPLRSFSMRFSRQVWPGDTLVGHAEVVALTPIGETAEVELSVEATNDRGQVVAAGSARAELGR